MGVHGKNVWRVEERDGEEDGLELVEEAEVTGSRLLMPFIMRTERRTHIKQGKRFAKCLEDIQVVLG